MLNHTRSSAKFRLRETLQDKCPGFFKKKKKAKKIVDGVKDVTNISASKHGPYLDFDST